MARTTHDNQEGLVHIANCVLPARGFMSRLCGLRGLRGLCGPGPSVVDAEICKDVRWFRDYVERANSVYLLPPPIRREWVIECDSCLTGGGGVFSKERCFAEEYNPDFIQAYPLIHELEALNLVVALRTLRPDVCAGLDIVVNTNNAGTGRATDATLVACAHEIWLLAALGSFTIAIRHKPGADLIFADALSRAHVSPAALEFVANYCVSHNVAQIRVTHDANDILSLSL